VGGDARELEQRADGLVVEFELLGRYTARLPDRVAGLSR
jgi:hypothetical protein